MAQWTVRQALFCLIGSTSATLFCSVGGYALWSKSKKDRLSDPAYQINSIVQTGPEREALKTVYLAELLSLSADKPINLYAFDLKKGREKLLSSPLIAQAEIRRLPPNTLYIDYEVRKPVAWLGDYKNIGIDRAGYLFPVNPFFSPKELTEIYLGLPSFTAPEDSSGRKGGAWHTPVNNRHLHLAFDILQFLEGSPWREGFRVKRIDVSNAFASSLGQREVVLFTEEEIAFTEEGRTVFGIFPKILRLAPREYQQQLSNFFVLRKSMAEDYRRQIASSPQSGRFNPRTIDLRIPQLAFVENY